MLFYQILLLALIQGITEFLPVSSSGHLALFPALTGLEDQGLPLDIAVHLGTLGAVILYFRSDVTVALAGVGHLLRGRTGTQPARLAQCLIIATIPVMVAGLLLHVSGQAAVLRSTAVIGWAMLGFGLLLYLADIRGPQKLIHRDWSPKHAVVLGLWQVLALIPGTSRSGICITGARFLGYGRADTARIAMLMSIPVIIASGAVLATDMAMINDMRLWRDIGLAMLLAFVSALSAISLMMRLLRRVSYTPFVIYRAVLGGILLMIAYS